jgi:hypothetical protein
VRILRPNRIDGGRYSFGGHDSNEVIVLEPRESVTVRWGIRNFL